MLKFDAWPDARGPGAASLGPLGPGVCCCFLAPVEETDSWEPALLLELEWKVSRARESSSPLLDTLEGLGVKMWVPLEGLGLFGVVAMEESSLSGEVVFTEPSLFLLDSWFILFLNTYAIISLKNTQGQYEVYF